MIGVNLQEEKLMIFKDCLKDLLTDNLKNITQETYTEPIKMGFEIKGQLQQFYFNLYLNNEIKLEVWGYYFILA